MGGLPVGYMKERFTSFMQATGFLVGYAEGAGLPVRLVILLVLLIFGTLKGSFKLKIFNSKVKIL